MLGVATQQLQGMGEKIDYCLQRFNRALGTARNVQDQGASANTAEATWKLCFWRHSATAGPDRSERSPWAEESLTVSTTAVRASGVEEDIFRLRGIAP